MITARGGMTIQSPLRLPCQVDLQLPIDKNSQIIHFIFDRGTPVRLYRSVRHSISCYIQICGRWLAMSQRHYNQSHTTLLSLFMQWPIRDVQMGHRLLADWITVGTLSSETTSADVRIRICVRISDLFHSVNSFTDSNGVSRVPELWLEYTEWKCSLIIYVCPLLN